MSDLVGNLEDRFSCDAAHLIVILVHIKKLAIERTMQALEC